MELDPLICIGLLVAVISSFLLIAFNRWSDTKQLHKKKSNDFTTCKSPDCVRCEKYATIKSTAALKLKEFIQEHRNAKDLTRILIAFSDENVKPRKFTYQNPNVFFLPGLAAKPWWTDCASFETEKSKLKECYQDIKNEFLGIFSNFEERMWLLNTTPSGQWIVFSLYNQGVKMTENCAICPKTTSVIESLPLFMKNCVFGNALFSVLQPGTKIEEHFGPCNLRIRCHLGLMIPDDCHITVGQDTRIWEEEQTILFDDSFLHGVHHGNLSGDIRAILLVDLWHPYLTKQEQAALQHIF